MTVVVLVTAKNLKEARRIAGHLLNKKLAACVNLIEGVRSFFFWEGKMDHSREVLLIIKSDKKRLSRLTKEVKALHSYDTPEVIALPVIGGSQDYLRWIEETVGA